MELWNGYLLSFTFCGYYNFKCAGFNETYNTVVDAEIVLISRVRSRVFRKSI